MKHTILITFLVSIFIFGCKDHTSKSKDAPVSDLGHIDVILDSVTWYTIKNDSFIQNDFGVLNVDTAYYSGKPSYDLYLLGQLNFLHLSLAKDFWNNQQGAGVLVFQTQKPGQIEPLLNSWKQFYKDSLFVHSYKGSDFTLDEIMAWYKQDTTKPKEAEMFANLTSYSADAYKNWGITDSIINAGLAMKQFMGDWGGEPLKTRLFNSITELHMTMNQQEFKEIESALLAVGYKENKNSFTHSANPSIYITVSEEKVKSKYTKVKFRLNRSIAEKEIVFSPMAKLKLSGTDGWFIFD
ncbi:MAG: hypothetical protein KIS69_09995 [Bacteroidetes bacterium]|nr:hypothetical protein [Bacteroidota bacterium]MCB0850261.1 hypothetical protein [Bacteroidota bacterium]MCB8929530.1 hypothetical protein [Bacteroidia bacterium]MCW5931970.1 hypothetical protein [Bacteroidota bacterium]